MAKIVPGRNGVRTENFRPNVRIFRAGALSLRNGTAVPGIGTVR